jgi:hypothetical protein
MRLFGFTLVLFCVALVIPVAPAAEAPANVPQQQSNLSAFQQELINTQKMLLDALERGDAGYVTRAVADDFMLITPTGDTAEKADIVHDIHPAPASEPKPTLYEFHVVQLDEDCAVVSYKAVFPGAGMERYQSLSNTWVKQGGQWKLKFQQSTLNLWSAHDL